MAALYPTIGRYLRERVALGELARSTAHTVRYHLDGFAEHAGPTRLVRSLRADDVEGWLIDQQVASSTKYARLVSLRVFCGWCVTHRLCRTNPCETVRGPRLGKPVPRAIPVGDVALVLAAADVRCAPMVLLGAQEGLRRAEIAALSTDDVDRDTQMLRICGKGGKERYVPLSAETRDALERYLAAYPVGPGRPLFRCYPDPDRRLGIRAVGNEIIAAMKAAGVKQAPWDGRSAHALRHTCANDMLDHGADLRDVSEMLGHASLAVTADVYARRTVVYARLRNAAAGRTYATTMAGGSGQTYPTDHGSPACPDPP